VAQFRRRTCLRVRDVRGPHNLPGDRIRARSLAIRGHNRSSAGWIPAAAPGQGSSVLQLAGYSHKAVVLAPPTRRYISEFLSGGA